MVCARSDTPQGGLGMCTRCYSREFQIMTRILRKLIEASDAGHKSEGRNAVGTDHGVSSCTGHRVLMANVLCFAKIPCALKIV